MKHNLRTLLFIVSLLLSFKLSAQVYPVQINTQLTPPYSLRLSDYVAPGTNRIGVNMLLTDLNEPEYYVRLELTIEGDGITITTSPSFNPGPVILQGGVPEYYTSSDLYEWFQPQNLEFSGYSKSDYLQTGRLPEGVYRFSFRVYDYNKRVRVSNNTPITTWLLLNDPPMINMPFPDYKIEHINPQNIVFQWTPRHTGSPNSAFTTEYEFTLVEIWPEGRNPNDAILTSPPIFQTTTTNTMLIYGLAEPFLEPGRQYAYRIQAYDLDGRDMFKNNGYTEARMFIFGDECKPANNIEAVSEKFFEAEISWEPSFTQTAFNLRYRKADSPDAEWFDEETFLNSIKLDDLQALTKYEYQVMGYCGTYESEYSGIKTFTTPDQEPSEFECGLTDDDINITNKDPLPSLIEGDYIWSGIFPFKVTKASGGNGTFSGEGYATIPYLELIKLFVKFENIKINTDRRVYEGSITSIYNPDSPFVIGVDLGGGDETGEGTGNETTEETSPNDTTFTTDIDSVYIADNEIIIVNEDGTTDTIATNEDITIEDSNGDTWIVENGEVTTGGGTTGTGTGTGGNTPQAEVADVSEIKIKAEFLEYTGQKYGYDKLRYDIHKQVYEQASIYGKTEYTPWKSIAANSPDQVLVQFTNYDTTTTPAHVAFRTVAGVNLSATKHEGKEDLYLLNLTGKTHEEKEGIEAYVTYKDTSNTEKELIIGKLNTISYDKQDINLVIVPVNGDAGFTQSEFTTALNGIYNKAVVNWNVEMAPVYNINSDNWDKDNDTKMNDGESGLLSKYSDEQNKFRRQYKRDRDTDKNTYYVFLLTNIASKSGLAGYMPVKSQYSFIYSGNIDARTIAHELGHGAFRLWHTFSSESNYYMAEKSSDNLMDYNDGSRLHKYQWDFVHNPEGGLYLFTDVDEGALSENKELFILYNNQQFANNDSIFINKGTTEIVLQVNTEEVITWEGVDATGLEATVNISSISDKGKLIKVQTVNRSTVIKVFPPNKIVKIIAIDKYFAPTIENLDITYSLFSDTLKNAKIEIFKNGDITNPIYVNSSIATIGKNINVSWNGKINMGQDNGKYVSIFDSPYTVKISATYDEEGSYDESFNDIDKTKVELESIKLTPSASISLVKPNRSATEIDQEIEAIINIMNKQKNGVTSALPFVVHFSFEDPDDVSSKHIIDANGFQGNDNTTASIGGKAGANSIMWKLFSGYTSRININSAESDVKINGQDKGKAKVLFSSSVVAGDNYILVAQIKNATGNVLKEEKTGKWTVRKSVSFTNVYEMAGSFNMQQIMSVSNIDPAFSGDGCTDYSLNINNINLLSNALSPEYLAPLLPPIPLIDPATGQPNPNTELPTAQELQDYNSSNSAVKVAAEIAIQAKAQAWFNRNNRNLSISKNNYVQQANIQSPSIVGARYYHPKLDGRSSTGQTNYYPTGITINAANGNNPPITVDPDSNWRIVQGFKDLSGNTWMFKNISTPLRQKIVARHEVGHASDHVSFGNGDHASSGLMHYTGDIRNNPPSGDSNFSDDSINKLRGRR